MRHLGLLAISLAIGSALWGAASLTAVPARAGNGVERGGGDEYALAFIKTGQEIAAKLATWRQRHPLACREIPVGELESALTDIKVVSYPRVYLRIRGKREEVGAVNDPRRRLIQIGQERWDRLPDAKGRISFVLHEYLRFLKVEDGQYQVSGCFLSRLQNETEVEDFRNQVGPRIAAFAAAAKELFEPRFWMDLTVVRMVRYSSDYRACTDPKASRERANQACRSAAEMVRDSIASTPAAAGEKVKASLAGNQILADLRAYLARLNHPERARFAEAQIDRILDASDAGRSEHQRLIQEFRPILEAHCPARDLREFMPCALDFIERDYFGGRVPATLERPRKQLDAEAERAAANVAGYSEAEAF